MTHDLDPVRHWADRTDLVRDEALAEIEAIAAEVADPAVPDAEGALCDADDAIARLARAAGMSVSDAAEALHGPEVAPILRPTDPENPDPRGLPNQVRPSPERPATAGRSSFRGLTSRAPTP